ncbi:MAG: helix-turn-helix domain-containing protein, partial [Bacteroidales bacterium]|nr:helix-turn-helix domain-containing protein [Bacteroidales bacterium]
GRKGGHPKVNKDTIEQAMTLYDSQKYPVSQILKMSGICRRTLYKYINLRKEEQEKQQKQQ